MADRIRADMDGSGEHEQRESALLAAFRKIGDRLEDNAPALPGSSTARLRQAAQVLSLIAKGDARTTGLRAAGNSLEEEAPPFDSEAGADRLRQTANARGFLSDEGDAACPTVLESAQGDFIVLDEDLPQHKDFEHAANETTRLKDTVPTSSKERAELEEDRLRNAETFKLQPTYYAQIQQQMADKWEQVQQLETQLRDLERENEWMRYDRELTQLKAQVEMVSSALRHGLADHSDIEHVTRVVNGLAKSLESVSSGSSQPESLPERDADQSADGPASVTSLNWTELSSADAERMADMFKALADPTRLRLFYKVAAHRSGEASVCDIQSMGISTHTVSYHLKKLREAGLIASERRGTWVYCRVAPGVLPAMAAMLTGRSASASSDELASQQEGRDEYPAVPGNDVEIAPGPTTESSDSHNDHGFTHIVLVGNG